MDKLAKLQRYADDVKNKLSSPPSAKHKKDPTAYYEFWQRELTRTQKKIDGIVYSAAKK
jgi:hypothetical protein